MAAFLGEFLILDLDGGHTGVLVALHGVAHVEQAAIACVGVGDDRARGAFHDLANPLDHVAVGGDARVRKAEIGRHRAIARDIKRLEIDGVGDERGDEIEHARRHDEFAILQRLFQFRIGHSLRPRFHD